LAWTGSRAARAQYVRSLYGRCGAHAAACVSVADTLAFLCRALTCLRRRVACARVERMSRTRSRATTRWPEGRSCSVHPVLRVGEAATRAVPLCTLETGVLSVPWARTGAGRQQGMPPQLFCPVHPTAACVSSCVCADGPCSTLHHRMHAARLPSRVVKRGSHAGPSAQSASCLFPADSALPWATCICLFVRL
jgi:hypothetical protein